MLHALLQQFTTFSTVPFKARNRLVLYLGHNLSCDWEYAEEVCFAAFIEDMIQFVRVFPRLTTLAREEEVCQKLSEFRILADQPSMSRKESRVRTY